MNIKLRHLIYLFIAILDMALILCSYFLASYLYLGDFLAHGQLVNIRILSWRDSGLLFLIAYSFLLVLGYAATRVFGSIYLGRIRKMAKSVVVVNLLGLVLFMSSFYIFNLDDASRVLVFLFFVFSTASVCFANWIAIHLFRLHRNSKKYRRNVLVVGCGHLAEEYAKAVAERSSRPEHVIGFIDPNLNPYLPYEAAQVQKEYLGSCLGSVWNIDYVFQSYQIEEIVLALDVEDYTCVRHAVAAADRHGISLTLVPFYNDIIPRKPNIDSFGRINLVDLRSMPLSNPLFASIKRFFDIVVSLIVIILTSWLMVITAIGVKLSSPGPVFFKQLRMGRYNKPFEMLKFRSMAINDESDVAWSKNDDPRKTRFGSFIRKYSIDELPQFFNVLKGDMSIVGPRPEIPFYVQQFSQNIPLYMLRHQVRPGITGLAQINGLRGNTSITDRIESDLFYIQHWSFWLDVKIFFKTLFGGFVNDETIAESGLWKRISDTRLGKLCLVAHESAINGTLGKLFNIVYLLLTSIYLFALIFYVPVLDNGVFRNSIAIAMTIALLVLAFFVFIFEARKALAWIVAVTAFILLMIVYRRSGISMIVTSFALVVAYPKNLKIDTVAKVAFAAILVGILSVIGCYLAGLIPDVVGRRGNSVRHSFGFVNANTFATRVIACMIPYIYFRLEKWKWTDIALCLIIDAIVFYVTQGRMTAIMILFLIAFASLCRIQKVSDFFSKIAPWIFVGCFCATILFCYIYWQSPETSFSTAINQILSGRPEFISSYLDDYRINLFGQYLKTVSAGAVALDPSLGWRGIDCSYMSMLLRFGIVGTLVLLLPTIWLGCQLKNQKYTAAIVVLTTIAIFSMVENFYYEASQNFGIFIMAYFVTAWATRKHVDSERASAPITRNIDWVNIKGSRWKDFYVD